MDNNKNNRPNHKSENKKTENKDETMSYSTTFEMPAKKGVA